MAQRRKPIPKTQQEIITGKEKTVNRAEQIKRNDTAPNFYMGLYDIDESIQYYFDNVIKPTVTEGEELIKVPVLYGSPERWKSVQKNGFSRDVKGKTVIPLIMYRRSSVAKNREFASKIDANNPQLFYDIFKKKYNKNNRYDKFNVLHGRTPSVESYNIVVPDYVTISYDCIIWTDYVEHMNKLIESINYASDSYWGDPEKYKFKATISDYSLTTDTPQGADRMVRAAFNIQMNGYIIPDALNKELSQSSIKSFSKTKIVMEMKEIDNITNIPRKN
tara:strand:- start:20810 stop:21637 length:828 start_codon:yes stop_codon:yes gene_type:complete